MSRTVTASLSMGIRGRAGAFGARIPAEGDPMEHRV
jgi:hypothetical protein